MEEAVRAMPRGSTKGGNSPCAFSRGMCFSYAFSINARIRSYFEAPYVIRSCRDVIESAFFRLQSKTVFNYAKQFFRAIAIILKTGTENEKERGTEEHKTNR